MGTALSMNSLAEGLGMSLPGCAAIPAPYGERARMAYETGRRIVRHGAGRPHPEPHSHPRSFRKRDCR